MYWQDQIQVTALDHMGDDLRIANVARVSFDKWKDELDSADVKLINYLAKHEHSSPFRHTAISLRCTAPIWLARQLVKHQVGLSWNEVSRRYVDTPVELFNQEFRVRPQASIKQGSGDTTDNVPLVQLEDGTQTDIQNLMQALTTWYDDCIALGLAPETVRGYLPLNMMTSWVWTGSLPAFFHLFRLRADGHAQKEAQVFAHKVEAAIRPLFPHSWAALEQALS